MHLSDYTYELPDELIAQHPPTQRGKSRLLVLQKDSGTVTHKAYSDVIEYLSAGDVLVLNNTKVIKARLLAKNAAGKDRELLLLEKHGNEFGTHNHKVLYRGKIHANEQLFIANTPIVVQEILGGGLAIITSQSDLLQLSEQYGSVPLPPYMHRSATQEDIQRYQTVFATQAGSVAAPTASLNFTEDLADKLRAKGIEVVYLTLHVGLGTFLPIRTDDLTKHKMHSEYYEIPAETIATIQSARATNRKVLAIGTTVARTLEFCAQDILTQKPSYISGEADIFIYPGYKFKVVDMLLTNFHAPKSTVLMLVAAFAGWDNLLKAYKAAIKEDYHFLSYGDSMLIY